MQNTEHVLPRSSQQSSDFLTQETHNLDLDLIQGVMKPSIRLRDVFCD